jgi:signal transduction histidine kinase
MNQTDRLFDANVWTPALQKFGAVAHLTVALHRLDETIACGPVPPSPLFALLAEYDCLPTIHSQCVRQCLAQDPGRVEVVITEACGLGVVGASLVLDGQLWGAVVAGYALTNMSQTLAIERLARDTSVPFRRLWEVAQQQQPVPVRRLEVHGELLQVLADTVLEALDRVRHYEEAASRLASEALERSRAQEELRRAHAELERRVLERTTDLAAANTLLETENRERRRAEAQIKSLFQRLVAVQEEERRRIARDIHDQLGQQMTALRRSLDAVRMREAVDPSSITRVARTEQLAEELDRSIDFLTWDLRPAALDHLGLAAALRNLVEGWSARFMIAAEFQALDTELLRLPSDTETNLYRMAQEALHNVVKHARATHVAAYFHRRDGEAVLAVEDNGVGFDTADIGARPASRGLGLVSMRERTMLVGGTLEIDSTPDHGTTIFVRVPLAATDIDDG